MEIINCNDRVENEEVQVLSKWRREEISCTQ